MRDGVEGDLRDVEGRRVNTAVGMKGTFRKWPGRACSAHSVRSTRRRQARSSQASPIRTTNCTACSSSKVPRHAYYVPQSANAPFLKKTRETTNARHVKLS